MLRRLVLDPLRCLSLQNDLFYLQIVQSRLMPDRAKFSTSHACKDSNKTETIQSINTLNKAMKAYLERAKEHDEFMATQRHEYEIGKRHLANMMGEDPETFTQEDVDNAIEYLFPSGLFEKKARPLMKPPEEVFPQRKAAEFDETGRPHHFLFYTGQPNFYQVLHEAVQHINDLYKFDDSMISKGLQPDPNLKLDLSGTQLLEKSALEQKLVETIGDREYANFQKVMERLYSLPYSYKAKDFLLEYRKPMSSESQTSEAIVPQIGEDGRQFVSVYECRRKRAIGTVTVKMPGTGQVRINGQDIHYFEGVQQKEQVMFPLIFSDMLNKVDVEAEVQGGGPSGQAGAIRWGISWALRSFLDPETIDRMRLAGLLSPDIRTRERKKPGQWGARRKFTWKKR